MAQIERISFAKDMAIRNKIFEKKLDLIKRNFEEQERLSNLYSKNRDYLEKLVSQTNEKFDYASKEIDEKNRETKSYVEETIAKLSSEFSHTDLLKNVEKVDAVIDEISLNRCLNVPHEALAKKLELFKSGLESQLGELTKSIDSTSSELTETQKSRDLLLKERAKEEKHIAEWKLLIEEKNVETGQLETEVSSRQKKLENLESSCRELEKLKAEKAENLEKLAKEFEEKAETEAKARKEQLDKRKAELNVLEDHINKISSMHTFDIVEMNLNVPKNEKIADLLLKLAKASEELAQAKTETGGNVEKFEITENDSLEALSLESEALREQKRKMESEILEMKQIRHQLLLKQQENSKQTGEIESAKERIRQKSLKLESLMKAKNEKEKMQLNVVSLSQNPDYSTPKTVKVPNWMSQNKKTPQKRDSSDSDDVKRKSEELSYPGIRPLSKATKKKVEEAVMMQQKVSEMENTTMNSSMNSSLISGDTGTTQEGSIMGGMFSPLSNRFEEEEDADKSLVDFSMMDHFREYTDRSSGNILKNSEVVDSVSRRFSSDIFLKKNENDSEIASNPSEAVEVANEAFDDDDEDDSLLANDSDLDLDQSDWGSDV